MALSYTLSCPASMHLHVGCRIQQLCGGAPLQQQHSCFLPLLRSCGALKASQQRAATSARLCAATRSGSKKVSCAGFDTTCRSVHPLGVERQHTLGLERQLCSNERRPQGRRRAACPASTSTLRWALPWPAGPSVLRGIDPRIIAALTDNPELLRALVQVGPCCAWGVLRCAALRCAVLCGAYCCSCSCRWWAVRWRGACHPLAGPANPAALCRPVFAARGAAAGQRRRGQRAGGGRGGRGWQRRGRG